MTNIELKEWTALYKQSKNGYHMSDSDYRELLRLNFLVMEICHEIHNNNMLDKIGNKPNVINVGDMDSPKWLEVPKGAIL